MNRELTIDNVLNKVFVTNLYDVNPGFRTIVVTPNDSVDIYVEANIDEQNNIYITPQSNFLDNLDMAEKIIRSAMECEYESEGNDGESEPKSESEDDDSDESEDESDSESEDESDSESEDESGYGSESEGEPLEIPEGH